MSPRLKQYTLHWLPLVVYCAMVFMQSAYPAPEKLPSFFLMDKMIHFTLYAVMGLLFYRAYKILPLAHRPQLLMLLSFVSASLYGISDEIHQYFVPYREADFFDVVADALGAACGVYLYHYWLLPKILNCRAKRQ
jgi:VanZ family protein